MARTDFSFSFSFVICFLIVFACLFAPSVMLLFYFLFIRFNFALCFDAVARFI